VDALGEDCGAVILDAWTRILYWLVPRQSTLGWDLPHTVAYSETAYIAVPSLAANPHGLHWLIPPSQDRFLTDPKLLRVAVETAIQAAFGPRETAS
jgi:hypothetical protein